MAFDSDEYEAFKFANSGESDLSHKNEEEIEGLRKELQALKQELKGAFLLISEQTKEIQVMLSENAELNRKINRFESELEDTIKPGIEDCYNQITGVHERISKKFNNELNKENVKSLNSQSAKCAESVYKFLKGQPIINNQQYLLAKDEIVFLKSKFPELKHSKNIYLTKDRINEAVIFMYPDVEFTSEPLTNYNKNCKKRPRKILKIKDRLL